jgi:hypothetical protein
MAETTNIGTNETPTASYNVDFGICVTCQMASPHKKNNTKENRKALKLNPDPLISVLFL